MERLVPPPRFARARFDNFTCHPRFPSQQAVVKALAAWPQRRSPAGLYLDGGFGVGKTHLLAATYHSAPSPKAYCSFEELTYLVGLWGMPRAIDRLSRLRFLFLDEFDLDDPGNTQLITHLLGASMDRGLRVLTTSNTPPLAQGQGKFGADQFRQQIYSLSQRFEVLILEGEDRRVQTATPSLLSQEELRSKYQKERNPASYDTFDTLLGALRKLHPIRYRLLLDGLRVIHIEGLHAILDQNDALRFVYFLDQLYNHGLTLRASGHLELFPETYRFGAYSAKYGRALSRLSELLASEALGPSLSR